MKILYVCPFANHAGHPPTAAATETKALQDAGIDVTLLTFDGLMHGVKSSVPEIQVIKRKEGLVNWRKNFIRQWMLRCVETSSIFDNASRMKGYDVIHVRDGDPFVWMPLLCAKKSQKWVVSLMGSSIFAVGNQDGTTRKIFDFAANGYQWKPVIQKGLKNNTFVFIVQDKLVKDAYKDWIDGVIYDHIEVVERGAPPVEEPMDKIASRLRLGLPLDKAVGLLFGAPHAGKYFDCVFMAVSCYRSNCKILFAGSSQYSNGINPEGMAHYYGVHDALVIDKYIPEEDKKIYFGAADFSILSYRKEFKATSSMLWESCRFGVPVIASDANHLKDAVLENNLGEVFEAENCFSLHQAIERWKARTDKEQVRQNCIKYAQDNSLNVWAKKCIKIYEGMK